MNMHVYTTAFSKGKKHQTQSQAAFRPDTQGIEKGLINLYPQVEYQTIAGFGGAFTDAAGYVFCSMPAPQQEVILDAYFGPGGLQYTWGRTHMDSCDFSLEQYEAVSDPGDTQLASFSLERANRNILPMLTRANAKAGKPLAVMMTPWSPPAFMKTNGRRSYGGFLKKEYYPLWARYLCKYVRAYKDLGVDVQMLSVQNEPKAVQTWDSCIFTGEQEREFIRNHQRPEMARTGLQDVSLLIWDHNKERAFERACEVISDPEMDRNISGVAVHWYSGDHFEALSMIRERFPEKRLVFSEACVEYLVYKEQNPLMNARMYAHELIGGLNHGLDTFIDWNLVLNEQGGPNHAGNYCDAPIMCDTEGETVRKSLSYDYIGHFSRHILPGAKRIGFSRFGQEVEVTVARNPDGSLCVVAMNPGDKDISFHLRLKDAVCPALLPGDGISTFVISEDAYAKS